jgi:zinc protease
LAIEQEVRSVAEAGISADELERARAVIEAADVFDGDNQLTHALRYAEAIANDRSIEDIEARSKRLTAVTTEQVRQAAQTYLRREQSVTGILLPVVAATTQPRQAGALQ